MGRVPRPQEEEKERGLSPSPYMPVTRRGQPGIRPFLALGGPPGREISPQSLSHIELIGFGLLGGRG